MTNAECTHSRFTSDSQPLPNRFSVWCSRFAVGYACTPWIFVLPTSNTVPDCPVGSVEKFQHVGIFGLTEGQSAGSCTNMHMKAVDWRGRGCAWPVWSIDLFEFFWIAYVCTVSTDYKVVQAADHGQTRPDAESDAIGPCRMWIGYVCTGHKR